MEILKLFSIIVLISCMIWGLSACKVAKTQPSPLSVVVSATPTPTVAEAKPSSTVLPGYITGIHDEYQQIFETVWDTVNQTYFDPDFGGLDWNAIHAQYEPLILTVEDADTFYQFLNQMLWELKASHAAVGPAEAWPSVEPLVWGAGKIGIDLRLLDGQAVITRLEAGSSADEAGLHLGYIIQSIEGIPVEQIIADAQEHLSPPYNEQGRINILTNRLLGLIYGDPGTCVTLTYLDENDERHAGCIERVQRSRAVSMTGLPLPPLHLEFESRLLESGIGYIRFNTFLPEMMPDFVDAVANFQDVPGIILDLRGNPGGDLHADGQVAAQFLEGQVTLGGIMTRAGIAPWVLTGDNAYVGTLVILIDSLSFSGSEFVAAGLQAIGRATIVGEPSPGGAIAANVATLSNGAILIYPVAQYLAPDGEVVEGRGVIPDITVPLQRSQLLDGIDAQLKTAIQTIVEVRR